MKPQIETPHEAETSTLSTVIDNGLLGIAVASMAACFLAASLDVPLYLRLGGFAFVVAAFIAAATRSTAGKRAVAATERIDRSLSELDDAQALIGSSLSSSDAFRLICSRLEPELKFSSAALLERSAANSDEREIFAYGSADVAGKSAELSRLNDEAYTSKRPATTRSVNGGPTAAAVPLIADGEVFAVLDLIAGDGENFLDIEVSVLEAVGIRVGELMSAAMSFDRSVSAALTDPVTGLPNERAFFVVFENHLAESHRNRSDRPLSVLSAAIRNFEDITRQFGFSGGERVLSWTAEELKAVLREMDLLARAGRAEFLAVLPTASSNIADEIVERLSARFADAGFSISDTETVRPELAFGVATFLEDGERSDHLLASARQRRRQSVTSTNSPVVWIDRESARI